MIRSRLVAVQFLVLALMVLISGPRAFGQANGSNGGVAPPPVSAPAPASGEGAVMGDPAARPAQPQGFGNEMLLIMGGFLVLMIFMTTMAGRKEKKRRATMMSSLRRHDKIVVGGGMIGTIMELKDDEVVVKVDESTNTRIRFRREAIQSVLKQSGADESAEAEASS